MRAIEEDLRRRVARAKAGNVDETGEVVDLVQRERLRAAISPYSTVDVDRHLRVVVSLVRGRGS